MPFGGPGFKRVVARLAAPKHTVFVLARVVRCQPFDNGSKRFLVGCELLQRVRISE